MIQTSVGDLTRLHFSLFQEDGITPETGKVDGEFDKSFYKENTEVALSSTVTEIGSTGVYFVEFTPDDVGRWYLEVICADFDDVYGCLFNVNPGGAVLGYLVNEAQMNVAYDESITTLYLEVWLDRNGQSVSAGDLISCSVEVYDDGGNLLFTESSLSPDLNGRFSLQRTGVTLNPDRPYNANVTVTDTEGSVTTFQAFTTVG